MHLVIVALASTALMGGIGCGSDAADPPGPSANGGSGGLLASGGSAGTPGATSGGSGGTPGVTGGGSAGAASGGAAGNPTVSGGSGGLPTSGGSAGTPSTGGTATVTATYTKDVQPILMAKCGICHGGQNLGNHNIATMYEDAMRHAEGLQYDECAPGATGAKTIGECSLLLVQAGKMPAFSACDKPEPPDPAVCVSKSETDVLAAWVAGGMPR